MPRYKITHPNGASVAQELIRRWLRRQRPNKEVLSFTCIHLINGNRENVSVQEMADLLAMTMRTPTILSHKNTHRWPFLAVDPHTNNSKYHLHLAWSQKGILLSTDGHRMHVTKLQDNTSEEIRTYNAKGEQVDTPDNFEYPYVDNIFSAEDFVTNTREWKTLYLSSHPNTTQFWLIPDGPYDSLTIGVQIDDKIVNARYLLEASQSPYILYKWKNDVLVVAPDLHQLDYTVAYIMPLTD